jgi:hypothetical protein
MREEEKTRHIYHTKKKKKKGKKKKKKSASLLSGWRDAKKTKEKKKKTERKGPSDFEAAKEGDSSLSPGGSTPLGLPALARPRQSDGEITILKQACSRDKPKSAVRSKF